MEHMSETERTIAKAIVRNALDAGFTVSVFEGGAWAIKRSTNEAEILAAMASTDEDSVTLRRVDGTRVGTIALVYGNGAELISDSSDNADMCAFLAPIEARAATLE